MYLTAIREHRVLYSAGHLLELSGRTDLLNRHRRGDLELQCGTQSITVRDQDRLVLASQDLEPGVSLADYIAYLNQWVYFWPGDWRGPASRAKGLAEATGREEVAIIRMPLMAVVGINPNCNVLGRVLPPPIAPRRVTLVKQKSYT